MKVNYQDEYNKQLIENINNVRKSINNVDFKLKITNHAKKFNRSYDDVKNKIMSDDMFSEIFAKDPSKQNIYEKTAAKYISSLIYVKNFQNLANNNELFVNEGKITFKSYNNVKSIDFIFNIKEYNFYCSHKYIKDLIGGGAQDNQFTDIKIFLNNCQKINEGVNYFIAICDGNYFTDSKIINLNKEFGSSHVIALNIEYLDKYLKNFL